MLATHMVMNHNAIVKLAARATSGDDVAAQARAAEAMSKLQRAFAQQVEVMARHQKKDPEPAGVAPTILAITAGGGSCSAEKCGWVRDARYREVDLEGNFVRWLK